MGEIGNAKEPNFWTVWGVEEWAKRGYEKNEGVAIVKGKEKKKQNSKTLKEGKKKVPRGKGRNSGRTANHTRRNQKWELTTTQKEHSLTNGRSMVTRGIEKGMKRRSAAGILRSRDNLEKEYWPGKEKG